MVYTNPSAAVRGLLEEEEPPTTEEEDDMIKALALCMGLACIAMTPAEAQTLVNSTSNANAAASLMPVFAQGINSMRSHGAHRPNARQHRPLAPRRVVGKPIAPQKIITEHPPASAHKFRCFANGQPSGGPGTGTGWCD
ncbi:MAG: hypothetical protein JWL87_738 [Candidatus Adlerbacteria bacterium]|nr:hypothetical protein [Candidatus Adlerbacteria bacterium]